MKSLEKIDVYYNLHRLVWSCRSRVTGRVVAHPRVVTAPYGATFAVQEAGRQRVLETRQKNIHAFVHIDYAEISADVAEWAKFAAGLPGAFPVTYNPYKAGHFVRKDTGAALERVGALVMVAAMGEKPVIYATP